MTENETDLKKNLKLFAEGMISQMEKATEKVTQDLMKEHDLSHEDADILAHLIICKGLDDGLKK